MVGTWLSRLSTGVASLAVLAAALVGCSEDAPSAQPTQSATATSPTSAPESSALQSPTEPAPPALPAAAKEDSKAGVKAFAAFYLELLNHAAGTGDVRPLEAASRDCTGCDQYISLYRKTYASGGFFKDSGMRATTFFVRTENNRFKVLMTVEIPRTRFKLSQREEVQVGRSAKVSLTMTVDSAAARKVVTALKGVTT